ncbi:MAG: serine/threonine protein kinase, partial [Planctomycetales bacterium]|nr:serine/threonine protein kinase [Planctomycetales bacterium]
MNSPQSEDRDVRVAQLLEEISVRMLDGEAIDFESLIDGNPDIASQLRELATTVNGLAEWGNHSTSQRENVSANHELGDFRIVREIGRGGMGVVYEAEQLSLSRNVALKVLPFASLLDERQLRRFQTEARAAAILQHENIVSVYSVGCERGIHYYAMQLIDGVDLSEVIAQLHKPAPPSQQTSDGETLPVAKLSTQRTGNRNAFFRSIADLGVRLARAIDYAHQEGVVHRDIKPANL